MAAPAANIKNIGANLRKIIKELVVASRQESFNPSSPEGVAMLKKFANKAKEYKAAAQKENLTAKKANENVAANKAVAAAAAEVSAAAGQAAAAAGKKTKVALLNGLRSAMRQVGNAITGLKARSPVDYNKIIEAYDSNAKTINKRRNAANRMAAEYRNAPLFKKNFTPAGRKLTLFRRGGLPGSKSRQEFLNAMAAFYKKQINNRVAFEQQVATGKVARLNNRVRAAQEKVKALTEGTPEFVKAVIELNKAKSNLRLAGAEAASFLFGNVNTSAAGPRAPPKRAPGRTVPKGLSNQLNKARKNLIRAQQEAATAGVTTNLRNKVKKFEEQYTPEQRKAVNALNTAQKEFNRIRALNKMAMGTPVPAVPFGPELAPVTKGKFMLKSNKRLVNAIQPTRGPESAFFFTQRPVGNWVKLEKNAKGLMNYSSNKRSWTRTGEGFALSDEQKAANAYVRAMYAKTGRWGGPTPAANIVKQENAALPPNLFGRKNITNAAINYYISAPNKPSESNKDKRISHLREIVELAHKKVAVNAAKNIAAKMDILQELLESKKVKTMNYTAAEMHDTNVQKAYAAYTAAINLSVGKLPNAARKLVTEQRAKFNTEVKQVQVNAAARKAQLMANAISNSLKGKNGTALNAAIKKAQVNITTLPTGTNKSRAQAALNAALTKQKDAKAAASKAAAAAGPSRRGQLGQQARLVEIENKLRNLFITGTADPMNNASYTGLNKTSLQGLTPAQIKAHLNSLNNFKNTGTKAFNNAARKRMANYFQ